ncbi:hypothetical protein [Candidatus Magnetobacterium casense]|uniref:Uncharacterized protein n=1 Tax=Candidatus Magnetobacterium casense TaxID=1455061 RepID=A0ABS6S3Q9_9BACT|nr:hypothetical protein [Candidatus Magnetobacterium casensis]MBV6343481.1 hypothetical protein [Candidatus Magnetobacterium casensis]
MPKKKSEDHSSDLSAWRKSHWGELDATLSVLKGIRDDPDASNKDRVEASKSIGRLLAVMSPEKVAVAAEEKDSASVSRRNKPELPPALKAKLASVLGNASN